MENELTRDSAAILLLKNGYALTDVAEWLGYDNASEEIIENLNSKLDVLIALLQSQRDPQEDPSMEKIRRMVREMTETHAEQQNEWPKAPISPYPWGFDPDAFRWTGRHPMLKNG